VSDETDSEADALFAALCGERGGVAALSTIDIAVARKAAAVLASDAGDPRDAATLLGMLPAVVQRRVAGSDPATVPRDWNLSLLSDAEFVLLQRLEAKACSRPSPDITGEVSRRLAGALDLASALDAVADVEALLPADRHGLEISVRNSVHDILCPPFLPSQIFACYSDGPSLEAVAALRSKCEQLERELSPRAPNVVQLQRQRAHAAAEAAAPVVSESNITTLANKLSADQQHYVGDHFGA
jgi:hypothetical protein